MAIMILWASQCLGATQIRNGIVGTGTLLDDSQKAPLLTVHPDNIKPYNILILIVSLAYIAVTLDVTGIPQAAAFWVRKRGGLNGRKIYLYFYLLVTLISIIVGSEPAILSTTVFLVYYTTATEINPDAWLISEFAAANTASMVLFVGNPSNVIICEGFQINIAAFTAYTIIPFITCSIACYLVLMLQYWNEKHIPQRIDVPEHLNPPKILRDRVGATFGGIWLATCLIMVMVLSFFHVDVWKIMLPFAGGKFIFDICWDHYRYSTGKIPKLDESQPRDDVKFADDSMGTTFTTSSLGNDFERTVPSPPSIDSDSTATSNLPSRLKNALLLNLIHLHLKLTRNYQKLAAHFPTFFTVLPRLPFGLVPFTFSQFILLEALQHQGWIDIFARWFVIASNKQIIPIVWLVGVLGVILCNISGTSIGATILLTKIIRASDLPESTARAAAVSLAVASNIGAVNITFSASLPGLLWVSILKNKGIQFKQWKFAKWNTLPLVAMMGAGLGVLVTRSEDKTLVELLQPIPDASYTRDRRVSPPNSACLPGTRKVVIKVILTWVSSSVLFQRKHIFYLYGYAGSGKSAIAQENAGDRSQIGRLPDTLACQLATALPETAPLIRAAIDGDPELVSAQSRLVLGARLQALVYGPFKTVVERDSLSQNSLSYPYLIVIDGLDECEDKDGVQEFLDCTLKFFKHKPSIPLRIVITSRVEQHIHSCLNGGGVRLKDL
ncbi:hypothetical protein EST38_g13232, partial [Candolleomyces aberdarensis]